MVDYIEKQIYFEGKTYSNMSVYNIYAHINICEINYGHKLWAQIMGTNYGHWHPFTLN